MRKVTRWFWMGPAALLLPGSAAWAAGGAGGFSGEVLWQAFGFVLLAFFLARLLKKPLGSFLVKRRAGIAEALDQAGRKEAEAAKLLKEWESKIDSMAREIEDLHRSIREEGEEERRRIVARAEEEGERVQKQAQGIAEQEVKKARASLKKETVDLSVELAENILKESVQPQDQERLVKEYLGKMKEIR